MIACALSARTALIVADGAVSVPDVSVARQITDLMARLQSEDGVSFLFISHDIAVVERVSHRIAVMFGGQIVETGPTDRVLSSPAHAYTKHLLSAVPVPDPDRRELTRSVATVQIARPALLLPQGQQPQRLIMAEIAPGHFCAVPSEAHLRFAAALSTPERNKPTVSAHAPKHPAQAESKRKETLEYPFIVAGRSSSREIFAMKTTPSERVAAGGISVRLNSLD